MPGYQAATRPDLGRRSEEIVPANDWIIWRCRHGPSYDLPARSVPAVPAGRIRGWIYRDADEENVFTESVSERILHGAQLAQHGGTRAAARREKRMHHDCLAGEKVAIKMHLAAVLDCCGEIRKVGFGCKARSHRKEEHHNRQGAKDSTVPFHSDCSVVTQALFSFHVFPIRIFLTTIAIAAEASCFSGRINLAARWAC